MASSNVTVYAPTNRELHRLVRDIQASWSPKEWQRRQEQGGKRQQDFVALLRPRDVQRELATIGTSS
jgi:hypothetical protein